jgi:hypothetical protein
MRQIIVLLFLCLIIFSNTSHALVDYTEKNSFVPNGNEVKKTSRRPKTSSKAQAVTKAGRSGSFGEFEVKTGFQSINVESNDASGKVSMMTIDGHFQTLHNIYLDTSFWRASSNSQSITENSSSQNGNLKTIIGFNWLKMGQASDMATINFYGGASFKSTGSAFANSHTDQIYGVETTKRFNQLVLGLGFEMNTAGSPSDETEMATGSIQKLKAVIGWRVSSDIQLSLEAATVKVSESDDQDRFNKLNQSIGYGYMAPKIGLGLSPHINLNLGGYFRTKRVKTNEDIVKARLYDLPAVYGNSWMLGLSISI